MSIASEITRINTNIANAYTAVGNKGGTLPQTQNSANLATAISSITTGGGSSVPVQEKDINFYDYDGTRLHSYTLAEVQELTELPELPTQQGLICQGWNWTLADLKAEGKPTDVGATYITDDGKTRLYIHIATNGRMNVLLCFRQGFGSTVEVNWGDGSNVETFNGRGTKNILPTHQYSASGDYVITLNPIGNGKLRLGADSSYCVMGSNDNNNRVYQNMLVKVELGQKIEMASYAFTYCASLSTITIPNGVTIINDHAFEWCESLSSIIFPSGTTNIYNYSFKNCYSLSKISLTKNVSLGNSVFISCYTLSTINLPNSITQIGYSLLSNCYSLSKVTMSNNITNIQMNMFQTCYSLSKIIIQRNLNNIDSSAFQNCYGMAIYDFSNCSSVPTLVDSSVFSGIPSDCKIVVPDSLYNDWISASNWSNFSSYIVKASEV